MQRLAFGLAAATFLAFVAPTPSAAFQKVKLPYDWKVSRNGHGVCNSFSSWENYQWQIIVFFGVRDDTPIYPNTDLVRIIVYSRTLSHRTGAQEVVKIQVDRADPIYLPAFTTYHDGFVATIPASDEGKTFETFFNLLRSGLKLKIEMPRGGRVSLDLSGSRAAVDAYLRCLDEQEADNGGRPRAFASDQFGAPAPTRSRPPAAAPDQFAEPNPFSSKPRATSGGEPYYY